MSTGLCRSFGAQAARRLLQQAGLPTDADDVQACQNVLKMPQNYSSSDGDDSAKPTDPIVLYACTVLPHS